MAKETPGQEHPASGAANADRRIVLVTLAVAAAIGLGLLAAARLGDHAARLSASNEATETEDSSFCRRVGAGPDTARYPECRAGLKEIRLRHEQRNADFF